MKRAGSSRAPERQGRQLQGRDPSLGALLQRGDLAGSEVEAGDVVEVGRHLREREAEVGRADLDELAAGPQPRQRQVGVGSRAQEHVDVRGQVLDEVGDVVRDRGRVGEVVVVQDEVDPAGDGLERVEERGDDRAGVRRRRLEQGQHPGADSGHCSVESRHDVGPERPGVLLRRLERDPRDGAGCGGRPGREQRRLAEAGRPRDHGQPRLATGAQAVDEAVEEAGTRHDRVAGARHVELGPDEGTRHAGSPRGPPLRVVSTLEHPAGRLRAIRPRRRRRASWWSGASAPAPRRPPAGERRRRAARAGCTACAAARRSAA